MKDINARVRFLPNVQVHLLEVIFNFGPRFLQIGISVRRLSVTSFP